MSVAYISLGANLGDRAATLTAALRTLGQSPSIEVIRVSSFHETDPVGGPPEQPRYLNAAAELRTTLDAPALLARLLEIESQFGRVRTVKDAPRTLDLDILLYEDLVRRDADPIIPHPRMHERTFVLAPLAEIAPDAIHPVIGSKVAELLARLSIAAAR